MFVSHTPDVDLPTSHFTATRVRFSILYLKAESLNGTVSV